MPELKPCPFCGGRAELKPGKLYADDVVFVKCTKCHARTNFVWINHPSLDITTGMLKEGERYTEQQAKKKAIEAWNRRVNNEQE